MYIYIDNQRLPITPRTSRDLIVTLKTIARNQGWGIAFDSNRETIAINTKTEETPILLNDRTSSSEAESSRLANKKICIDPGHGGSDPGAMGPSGTKEKDNCLAISLLLRDMLEKHGAEIIMTRDKDNDVSYPGATANEELEARVDIANNSDADLFISIHNDSFTNPRASGTTTFHYGDKESASLAGYIQQALVKNLGTTDRGTRFASFYVIRHTNMPAVLVEVAFISNAEEEILLASAEGRNLAAQSIFEGILKYYKV